MEIFGHSYQRYVLKNKGAVIDENNINDRNVHFLRLCCVAVRYCMEGRMYSTKHQNILHVQCS